MTIEPSHRIVFPEQKPDRGKVVAAWAVHVFTATGVVLGMLALIAMLRGDELKAFLWLGLALFIDGIDGTLARRFHVREYTPQLDGAALDLVIDYLTYSFIPALMIYWFGMVPDGWGIPAACFVALTSLYCYANVDMKTADYYFEGFPAIWNLVVLYMHILRSPEWLNLVVIIGCGILTFVPWKYVHPLRVARLRPATLAMTVVWSGTSLGLVFLAQRDEHPMVSEPLVFWMWVAASLYFLAICVLRTTNAFGEGESES